MDALLRLRVLIWLLVLGLWGLMVYQYLGQEESAPMRYVSNPYKGIADFPPAPRPPPPAPAPERPSSIEYVKPPKVTRRAPRPSRTPSVGHSRIKLGEPAVPHGFVRTVTAHFNVYSEGSAAGEDVLETLENLHGNLMLDLAYFSPWASQEKVSVFLFKSQDTYREVTGRPPWSGGASSVPKRKVYVYVSPELPGILAHELCHIYYDGFFLDGQPDPLWLSEGMATLIQVERGLAAPNWLRQNMEILEDGGGFSLEELMDVTSTSESSDDQVRLWYAQSYSVVRFLMRAQYRSSFYKFSQHLRDGQSVSQALYRSYGMPFNRVKALEFAWRHELGGNAFTRLAPADAR